MIPATASKVMVRHPKQLYMLFFSEMWERFSFYGMKALLLAYMVTQLKFDEPKGYAIFGSYTALVYTMPMFGGGNCRPVPWLSQIYYVWWHFNGNWSFHFGFAKGMEFFLWDGFHHLWEWVF